MDLIAGGFLLIIRAGGARAPPPPQYSEGGPGLSPLDYDIISKASCFCCCFLFIFFRVFSQLKGS